jgi:hypothetical protein
VFAAPAAVHDHMNPGSLKSGSDFEITSKLARSGFYTVEANPHPYRRPMLLILDATAIVSDYHVHPITNPSQLD